MDKFVLYKDNNRAGVHVSKLLCILALGFLVFAFSCKQANNNEGENPDPINSDEITIMVKGDQYVEIKTPNSFKVKKNEKWKDFKQEAIDKVIVKDNSKEIKEWRIKDASGELIRLNRVFEKDETVYVVTQDRKTKYIVNIEGDERVKVLEPKSIEIPASTPKTFGDIKTQVEAKVGLKDDWSSEYYEFYDWRLGGEAGEEVVDSTPITDDIVVYARTNYKKFKVVETTTMGTTLAGYETEKPRGRIFLPKNIKSIKMRAFKECEGITAVDMSNCTNLTNIYFLAFAGCTGLTSVNLTGCKNVTKIWTSAFEGCTSLESMDLSSCTQLPGIGTAVFKGCSALTSVNLTGCSEIVAIELEAFLGCESLESIDLSSCTKLNEIGGSAFRGCSSLRAVNLTGCSEVRIYTSVFEGCSSLASIDLSPCTGLVNIPVNVFKDCVALKTVNLTGCTSLQYVEGGAFENCASLENMNFSSCSSFKGFMLGVFKGCTALKSVNLTDCSSFSTIGYGAFEDCSSLESIDLSSCTQITEIRDYAFKNCTALKTVNLTGCGEITGVMMSAFENCSSLENVDLSSCTKLTEIEKRLFHGCVNAEVKLPTTITKITEKPFGEDATSYCKKVIVPDGKAEIKQLVKDSGYPEERIGSY